MYYGTEYMEGLLTKIFFTVLGTGVLVWLLNFWRDHCYSRKKHDLKIIRKIRGIVTDKQINLIISKSSIGYIPNGTYSIADTLDQFINEVQNKFFDKKMNTLLKIFANDLTELASLYSGCWRCGKVGSNEYKLVLKKDGSDEEWDLLNKSRNLSKNLSESFTNLRIRMKNKYHL